MKSLEYLYRIGPGPSSSHTIGPSLACKDFMNKFPSDNYYVKLTGSLALTGKGHLTDYIIKKTLSPSEVDIEFLFDVEFDEHPNTMIISDGKNSLTYMSVGGGEIVVLGEIIKEKVDLYKEKNFNEIVEFCKTKTISLFDYVMLHENLENFSKEIWEVMKASVENGLKLDGFIKGELNLSRRAKEMYSNSLIVTDPLLKRDLLISSFAYAVSEQNASGELVVTSPTCGASGVLPAVLYYLYKEKNIEEKKIQEAILVAGVIGNVIKTNASISGAEAGCQAEIGSACAMASAAYSYIMNYSLDQIENACEIALEHHLGLTCDPILGLVQIPCIERNAVASLRAVNAANLAYVENKNQKISFDDAVKTMYETGKDINKIYRETALGGLAKLEI